MTIVRVSLFMLMSFKDSPEGSIDVNYVNVNAFCFYFTPILAEIDVKDIFYILPLRLRLCGDLRFLFLFLFPKGLLFHWSDFPYLLTGTSSHGNWLVPNFC